MYQVHLTSLTEKQIRAIAKGDRASAKRVFAAFGDLESDPRPAGIKALLPGFYRLRVGNFRIFYTVADDIKTIVVSGIERRSEATYKNIGAKRQQAAEKLKAVRKKTKKR